MYIPSVAWGINHRRNAILDDSRNNPTRIKARSDTRRLSNRTTANTNITWQNDHRNQHHSSKNNIIIVKIRKYNSAKLHSKLRGSQISRLHNNKMKIKTTTKPNERKCDIAHTSTPAPQNKMLFCNSSQCSSFWVKGVTIVCQHYTNTHVVISSAVCQMSK